MLDNLSKHPVQEIINKVLKNDAKKAIDLQAFNQFNTTLLRVAPTGGTNTGAVTLTTNGTCSTTNNTYMGKNLVKAIVDVMKERNIPYTGALVSWFKKLMKTVLIAGTSLSSHATAWPVTASANA